MMKTIETAAVKFASPENLDQNGRIFFWNDGVYRAINNQRESFYREVLREEVMVGLQAAGLVGTKAADITLDGSTLTVEHERIPVASYVTEWCASMLKSAAITTLKVALELEKHGWQLHDAHPWNVLFDGTKAKFADFTSIVPVKNRERWTALEEFVGTFVKPLLLMSEGGETAARRALVDWRTLRGSRLGNVEAVWALLKARNISGAFRYLWARKYPGSAGLRAQLESLLKLVEAIPVRLADTAWSDYCEDEVDLDTFGEWMLKRRTVSEVLDRCQPTRLLDIGCNTGWFSKLASLKGARAISFDLDEPSINRLFVNENAAKFGILPLVVNFINPPPAYGYGLRCSSAYERFRSEFVLGLAIVHHLVFKQNESFDSIVEKIARYSEKWLLIEFIPKEDKYVWKYFERWPSYHEKYSWYTTDNFIASLKKEFSKVEVLPSNPEPRILVLCER